MPGTVSFRTELVGGERAVFEHVSRVHPRWSDAEARDGRIEDDGHGLRWKLRAGVIVVRVTANVYCCEAVVGFWAVLVLFGLFDRRSSREAGDRFAALQGHVVELHDIGRISRSALKVKAGAGPCTTNDVRYFHDGIGVVDGGQRIVAPRCVPALGVRNAAVAHIAAPLSAPSSTATVDRDDCGAMDWSVNWTGSPTFGSRRDALNSPRGMKETLMVSVAVSEPWAVKSEPQPAGFTIL